MPPPNVSVEELDTPINGTVVRVQVLVTLDSDAVDIDFVVFGTFTRLGSTVPLATTPTGQKITTLTFDPLRDQETDGDIFYSVFVSPQRNFVHGSWGNSTYTLMVQPYPSLEITQSISIDVCNSSAVLRGNVTLLPNTSINNTLTYTWRDPENQPIPDSFSSGDLAANGGNLRISNANNNTGDYRLTVCLDVLESFMGHCSSATYTIEGI